MNLGQLIESELQAMQKRPARVPPVKAPTCRLAESSTASVAAALPQTIRDHAARQKAISAANEAARSSRAAKRWPLALTANSPTSKATLISKQ